MALFVAAEFAFVAVDRDRVEHLAARGGRGARGLQGVLRRLSFHLSGAQLGITVTSLVLGFIAEPAIAEVLDPAVEALAFVPDRSAHGVSIAVALALATVAGMVFGELVPKNLAIARPLGTGVFLEGPMRLYGAAFGPLIGLLNSAANRTVRLIGIEPVEELGAVRTVEELELLVRSSAEQGTLEPDAVRLLTRTFRFGDKSADEAMVPRVDLTALPRDASIADLARSAVQTGFTRFPVEGDHLDDILGVVVATDVFGVPPELREATPVTAVMRPVPAVPESRDLESLLLEMRESGTRMVVVVDEYGGTAGIVTLEDLLEEIVGDIEDEYDRVTAPPYLTAPLEPGTYVLEGSLHHDEVEELAGLEVPEGEYETLAGFLLSLFGRIPEAGDATEYEGWRFEVLEMERRRIALVRVTPPSEPPDTDAGEHE